MKRKHIARIIVVVALLAGTAGIAYVLLHPQVLHSPSWVDRELVKRTTVMRALWLAGERYVEQNDGRTPDSIHQLIKMDPELSDPILVQKDRENERILDRVVLLKDVRGPGGHTHRWLLVVLIPQSNRFGPFPEDYLYFLGDGELGNFVTIPYATKHYGRDVVLAVINKDREDRAGAATRNR